MKNLGKRSATGQPLHRPKNKPNAQSLQNKVFGPLCETTAKVEINENGKLERPSQNRRKVLRGSTGRAVQDRPGTELRGPGASARRTRRAPRLAGTKTALFSPKKHQLRKRTGRRRKSAAEGTRPSTGPSRGDGRGPWVRDPGGQKAARAENGLGNGSSGAPSRTPKNANLQARAGPLIFLYIY